MEFYSGIASWVSTKSAQPMACFIAFFIIVIWLLLGFVLQFNQIWLLIIDSLSSVVSILMLFIIQNTQNRHTIAIQLKLGEIIRATKGAHNEMIDIEKLTDEDLARIQKKYGLLAEKTKEELKKGMPDTHTPDIGNIITEKENKNI